MLGEKHDLIHELPEHKQRIHDLKMSDNHFVKLFDEYHNLDNTIRKMEEAGQITSDEYAEGLKKERLHLKDQLFTIIKST